MNTAKQKESSQNAQDNNQKEKKSPSIFTKIARVMTLPVVFFLIGIIVGLLIQSAITNFFKKTQPQQQIIVNRESVAERVSDQGFLVTRVAIIDQSSTINVNEGSPWRNFWWGHEIEAEGQMQVDVGVDLTKISEDQINIKESRKKIIIDVVEAEIYNVSLKDEKITLETKSGILKNLLAKDNDEDFNLALKELSKSARKAVNSNEELMNEATNSAENTLQSIFSETGYDIELE
jgi:hypothetical protein